MSDEKAKRDPICPTCTRPITDADVAMHHNCLPPASEPYREPSQTAPTGVTFTPAQPAEPQVFDARPRPPYKNASEAGRWHSETGHLHTGPRKMLIYYLPRLGHRAWSDTTEPINHPHHFFPLVAKRHYDRVCEELEELRTLVRQRSHETEHVGAQLIEARAEVARLEIELKEARELYEANHG